MMQGDSYGLPIGIKKANGEALTPADVADVEIVIGHLIKTYKKNEISYDEGSEEWVFPFTQEETFALPAMRVNAQARIVFTSGVVEGVKLGHVNVNESVSKEVL